MNLDYLDVEQNEPPQCAPGIEPNDEFDGDAIDRCRWTTVLNEDPSSYSLADGKLQIEAQEGDIVGGTVSARNVVLQRGPTDGSWATTTKVSIDGADDYIQAGLVAHASTGSWGKVVVMRRPTGEWVTELARESGFQNGPTLPAGAQNGITLQMIASDGQLRGRYSLDDGATWTEIGSGFPLAGLSAPNIGLSAYNGTGAEVGSFEYFHVGEPPDLPPPPPCEEPSTPEAGYTMLFDGTDESLEDWTYAGGGSFVREDCAIKSVGAFGLLYTERGLRGAVLAQARVDDARRRQLRRLRRVPRHRGEHGSDVDLAGRGDPDRRDGQPGPDHRRDLPRAGAGRRSPRRGAQPAG